MLKLDIMEIIFMFVQNNLMNVSIIHLFNYYKIKFFRIGLMHVELILNKLRLLLIIEILKIIFIIFKFNNNNKNRKLFSIDKKIIIKKIIIKIIIKIILIKIIIKIILKKIKLKIS